MKNTEKQAKYWRYAAWSAPFVALAILIGEILLGWKSHTTALIVITTFIATSVFWWWWAINRIVYIVKCSFRMEEQVGIVAKELKELREDVGNRKWREPNND